MMTYNLKLIDKHDLKFSSWFFIELIYRLVNAKVLQFKIVQNSFVWTKFQWGKINDWIWKLTNVNEYLLFWDFFKDYGTQPRILK